MQLPPGYDEARQTMWKRIAGIHGHLNDKEVEFLFLVAAVPSCSGEVLEIGSYMGRSTVVLSEGARLTDQPRVVAVDPLTAPQGPDLHGADSSEPDFRRNLEAAGVADQVEFHKLFSQDLAKTWNRPVRFLWIDGDHSHKQAQLDLGLFEPHLADGAIVAMHDVLHRTPGPMRVFMEDILLSDRYGACGLVGSIGWAQRQDDSKAAWRHRGRKLKLWKQISRLLPLAAFKDRNSAVDKRIWKLRRNLVPHGVVNPAAWLRSLEQPAAVPPAGHG